jgi:hypothetical protein
MGAPYPGFPVKCVGVDELYAAFLIESRTRGRRLIMGLAASPTTAVLPTCSTAAAKPPSVTAIRPRKNSKRRGQSGRIKLV